MTNKKCTWRDSNPRPKASEASTLSTEPQVHYSCIIYHLPGVVKGKFMNSEQELKQSDDYMVRGTAASGQIRFFAITSRSLAEEARRRHDTSPVITAALGRLLSGGAMMGAMMKGERDLLTLQIQCEGPVKGLTVTADAFGHVKGYPVQPLVSLPASPAGKLDVGRALGTGVLTVIRDIGLKEPYCGQVQLVSGEIAEDLTYYFAASEQTPSSVALGVRMHHNNTVAQAGGYIIQLMPDTGDEVVSLLERRLQQIEPVTTLLSYGHTPESMIKEILADFDPVFTEERIPAAFCCQCSRERMEKALISLGQQEIAQMIADQEPVQMNCHFCNSHYLFTVEDLKKIRKT